MRGIARSGSRDERTEPEMGALPAARGPARLGWTRAAGIVLCGLSAATLLFLLAHLALYEDASYVVLTSMLPLCAGGFGVLLIGLGWLGERRAESRVDAPSERPTRAHSHPAFAGGISALALFLGTSGAAAIALTTGSGATAIVHATESNEFCSGTCHSVMEPEAAAYSHSPHARVNCVDCHVGSGTESFLRAKLSGVRQLYKLATNTVERPIPTPIRNRRSSREMCESCHARDRALGYKAVVHDYFPSSGSMPARVGLLMHLGGAAGEELAGAHRAHSGAMAAAKIEYIARDAKRQDIPWVRVTRANGDVAEFSNELEPLSEGERSSLPVREMECVDCHSRPAHRFETPMRSVNRALAAGTLSAEIPWIKQASVLALDAGYESTAHAMEEIPEQLRAFYAERSPEVLSQQSTQLETASEALRAIYRRTSFPEMDTDWRSHPDNLGHLESPGCFRCHSDEMLNAAGEESLFLGCSRCHALFSPTGIADEGLAGGQEPRTAFVHPDDGEAFAEDEFTLCSDCHGGGSAELYE